MILASEILGTPRAGIRPVVLLHGLFGRGRNLAAIARALSDTRQAILLDLRNHGASPHEAGMSYGILASDVLATLDALHCGPAAFLGHSMGGKTAMACALLAPHAVERLLVADIAPVSYGHHNDAVAAALQAIPLRPGLSRAEADAMLQASVPDDAVRGFLLQNLLPGEAPAWRIGLDEIATSVAGLESWPDFGTSIFDGPTLFVRGADSDYVTAEGRIAARKLFPNARFITLKNAGHWLHADQPALFLQTAAYFLAS